MQRVFMIAGILVALTCGTAFGDPPRTRVTSIPNLGGRGVAKFILTTLVKIDRSHSGVPYRETLMVEILPGEFVPVAEDANGVFYQAQKGVYNLRPYFLNNGAIYVSKSLPQRLWVYVDGSQVVG